MPAEQSSSLHFSSSLKNYTDAFLHQFQLMFVLSLGGGDGTDTDHGEILLLVVLRNRGPPTDLSRRWLCRHDVLRLIIDLYFSKFKSRVRGTLSFQAKARLSLTSATKRARRFYSRCASF